MSKDYCNKKFEICIVREKDVQEMMRKKQIDFSGASDDEDLKIWDDFKIVDCFLYAIVDTSKLDLSEFMANQSMFSL